MSIEDEIRGRVAEGRLRRLVAVMHRSPDRRQTYMAPAVAQAVDGPWESTALEAMCGQARARLEGFMGGDLIVARMPPSKNIKTLLALLDPAGKNIWEFRIDGKSGGIRIFGRFAAKDVFVATNWKPRRWLKDDKRRWRDEIITCRTEWANLFPAYEPMRGTTIHDYISNATLPL